MLPGSVLCQKRSFVKCIKNYRFVVKRKDYRPLSKICGVLNVCWQLTALLLALFESVQLQWNTEVLSSDPCFYFAFFWYHAQMPSFSITLRRKMELHHPWNCHLLTKGQRSPALKRLKKKRMTLIQKVNTAILLRSPFQGQPCLYRITTELQTLGLLTPFHSEALASDYWRARGEC